MRTIQQAIVICLLAAIPAGLSAWLNPPPPPEPLMEGQTDMARVSSLHGPILWVDARSGKDYAAGHIPGAVLLNEDEWDALVPGMLDRWDEDVTIVVYCSGEQCDRSEGVARRLRDEVGLPNVLVLNGGWSAWLAAGGKEERP